MKLTGEFKVLNCESRAGVKDPTKTYYIVLLMQGTETLEAMCEKADVYMAIESVEPMSDVMLEMTYNPRYKS